MLFNDWLTNKQWLEFKPKFSSHSAKGNLAFVIYSKCMYVRCSRNVIPRLSFRSPSTAAPRKKKQLKFIKHVFVYPKREVQTK